MYRARRPFIPSSSLKFSLRVVIVGVLVGLRHDRSHCIIAVGEAMASASLHETSSGIMLFAPLLLAECADRLLLQTDIRLYFSLAENI